MQGSGAITVTGAGSQSNPYIVSGGLNLSVADTSTVDMTISGDGSIGTPYVLSGTASLDLNALTDVDTAAATTGQVLAKQASGQWIGVAATTAPTGAINLSSTGGLQGDGSAGSPLGIKLAPSSGLTLTASGLALSAGGGAWTSYTPTWTATTTNPAIGNGSLVGAYTQVGKTVTVSIRLVTGSTTTRGVGYWQFALPVAPVAARHQVAAMQVSATGVADYTGTAKIEGLTRFERLHIATSTAAQAMSHSVPASMPAGSAINITGVYEAA